MWNEGASAGVETAVSPEVTARAVLRRYWDGSLPVRPDAIAKLLGVHLKSCGGLGEPSYEFSGYFKMVGTHPMIEYNRADPIVRQRFTIAHELGHYALGHKDSPRDRPSSFGTGVSDPLERAANQFAAELLMPAESVRSAVRSGRFSSVEQLAKAFLVSKVAMGYRLTNLDIDL